MEPFEEALEDAKRRVFRADHMLAVTYPLLKESRLLVSVVENLLLGVEQGMNALLSYERYYKRIPAYSENFHVKFNLFRTKVLPRYSLSAEYASFIGTLKSLVEEHRKSPVEFSHKEKFVICSPNYSVRTLSPNDLKRHVMVGKRFVNEVGQHLSSQ